MTDQQQDSVASGVADDNKQPWTKPANTVYANSLAVSQEYGGCIYLDFGEATHDVDVAQGPEDTAIQHRVRVIVSPPILIAFGATIAEALEQMRANQVGEKVAEATEESQTATVGDKVLRDMLKQAGMDIPDDTQIVRVIINDTSDTVQ